MPHFFLFISPILLVWAQQTITLWIPYPWLRPHLPLLLAIWLGMQGSPKGWFVYAAVLGLCTDFGAHGQIGAYGLSFFVTSIGAHYLYRQFYESRLDNDIFFIGGFSLIGQILGIVILYWGKSYALWGHWIFSVAIPSAFWNAILAWLYWHVMVVWKRKRMARGLSTIGLGKH